MMRSTNSKGVRSTKRPVEPVALELSADVCTIGNNTRPMTRNSMALNNPPMLFDRVNHPLGCQTTGFPIGISMRVLLALSSRHVFSTNCGGMFARMWAGIALHVPQIGNDFPLYRAVSSPFSRGPAQIPQHRFPATIIRTKHVGHFPGGHWSQFQHPWARRISRARLSISLSSASPTRQVYES